MFFLISSCLFSYSSGLYWIICNDFSLSWANTEPIKYVDSKTSYAKSLAYIWVYTLAGLSWRIFRFTLVFSLTDFKFFAVFFLLVLILLQTKSKNLFIFTFLAYLLFCLYLILTFYFLNLSPPEFAFLLHLHHLEWLLHRFCRSLSEITFLWI